MKKIILLLLVFSAFLTSCNAGIKRNEGSIEVIDAIGREVEIPKNLSRIVIIGKQAQMLTNFLYLFEGAPQKLYALEKRTQSSDEFLKILDKNIEKKYRLERGAGAEQIAPLKPDLVLMKTSMRDTLGLSIEELSIPVIYVDFEDIDQIYRDIQILGKLMNEQERGNEIIAYYKELFEEVLSSINSFDEELPTVLILQADSSEQKYVFSIPASKWLQTNMVELCGGAPVWKDENQSGSWVDVNMEQISIWDPDKIFMINYQGQAPKIVNELKKDEIWQNLKAVRNSEVFAFPFDYQSWDQPDPRWILGFGWLTHKINPEYVNSEDVQSLVESFYKKLFDLSETMIQENIRPRIRAYFD